MWTKIIKGRISVKPLKTEVIIIDHQLTYVLLGFVTVSIGLISNYDHDRYIINTLGLEKWFSSSVWCRAIFVLNHNFYVYSLRLVNVSWWFVDMVVCNVVTLPALSLSLYTMYSCHFTTVEGYEISLNINLCWISLI